MQFAVGRALVSRFGSFGFDWSWRGCSRGRRISRGNFEFDLKLTAGSSGKSVLQETEIIILEPDAAEFVGRLQCHVVAINRAGSQRREPHVVGVVIQPGTEMFPCRIPNFFSRKLHFHSFKKPVFQAVYSPSPPTQGWPPISAYVRLGKE